MGLYWQGLTHDLSKYSPREFWPGVKYFQGNRSPIEMEKKDKGYSFGWLHHKGRNPHHWQYWIDMKHGEMVAQDMEMKYIKEMICDRIAACMVYEKEKYHNSSALEFHQRSQEKNNMSLRTKLYLDYYLQIVADNDLDTAIKIIRNDHTVI